MGPMGQNQAQRYIWSSSPDSATGDEIAVYDCILDRLC